MATENVLYSSQYAATPPSGLRVKARAAADDGAMIQSVELVAANGTQASIEERKQTPTGYALNVQIGPGDPISNLPVFIDLEQHQVHEGETHHAQDVRLNLNTTPIKYALTVPDFSAYPIGAPHLVISTSVYNNAVRVDLYEGATFTGGTPLTAYNRNRASATVPKMTIAAGVTSADGTLIDSWFAGGGSKSAGENRSSSEWVLKSNTVYRVDLTAQVTQTDCVIKFSWYEDLGV